MKISENKIGSMQSWIHSWIGLRQVLRETSCIGLDWVG